MPKVRDSFAHQFALEGVDSEMYDQGLFASPTILLTHFKKPHFVEGDCTKTVLQLAASRRFCQEEPHFRHVGSVSLKTSIANLLEWELFHYFRIITQ